MPSVFLEVEIERYSKPMHKTARDYALQRHISLGRYHTGYYYIADGKEYPDYVSGYPTAKSAIVMMRRYLRKRGPHLAFGPARERVRIADKEYSE